MSNRLIDVFGDQQASLVPALGDYSIAFVTSVLTPLQKCDAIRYWEMPKA